MRNVLNRFLALSLFSAIVMSCIGERCFAQIQIQEGKIMTHKDRENPLQNKVEHMPLAVPTIADYVKRNLDMLNDFSVLLPKNNDRATNSTYSTFL